MGTIAVVRLPPTAFALAETFELVPDVEFEVERVVATETEHVMPYVWVTADADRDAVERALDADSTTDDVELLVDDGDTWLYRMTWVNTTQFVIHVLVDRRGTVLSASGAQEGWQFRILFPERDDLSATYDFCETNDIPLEVEQVFRVDDARRGQYGLTEEQYETLIRALDRGYYEVPRKVSGEDLAAELGISHQALSERLRRGYRNLISNALVVGPDET